MKRTLVLIIFILGFVAFNNTKAGAHCEIPCGIYDDEARINLLLEHIHTIKKSMEQIIILQKKKIINYNQLVRWISNKEHHANEFQKIVTQYFMTQRIKPDTKKYDKKIGLLHRMLIYSMKCKQTTDLANTNKLKDLVKEFKRLYFNKK